MSSHIVQLGQIDINKVVVCFSRNSWNRSAISGRCCALSGSHHDNAGWKQETEHVLEPFNGIPSRHDQLSRTPVVNLTFGTPIVQWFGNQLNRKLSDGEAGFSNRSSDAILAPASRGGAARVVQ